MAEPLEISAGTREYVLIPWLMKAGGVPVDPAAGGFTPEMAFTAVDAHPATGDWNPAEWEQADGGWHAMCLVGSGGTVTLAAGTYDPWVRTTGPTLERPEKRSPGRVRVI